jgi:alkanesulfonate monooxygenase SsuD/methylene tetrahydromethanopterin reductase-like flavin-dependent oxidoreductase (luciferase family)
VTRPLRFGIVNEQRMTCQAWLERARRADAADFATVLLRDHLVPDFFGDQFAPISALAVAAGVTTSLRVGTLVLANDVRHPVVLAKEAATLDLLSHGRLELGIGAGRLTNEYRGLAGREADTVGILTTSIPTGSRVVDPLERMTAKVAQKVAWVRAGAGERFAAIELSLVPDVVATEQRRDATERYIAEQGWGGIAVEQLWDMPAVFIGSVDQIVDEMRRRREELGRSYFVAPDAELQTLAPIVARLSGL